MKKLSSVIVLDDDEATGYLHELVIRELNCAEHIHVFQSSAKAIDFISQAIMYDGRDKGFARNDIIFLDLNMPPISGWEFLKQYAQLPEENRKRFAIFILTSSTDTTDKAHAQTIPDVLGFYNKPLTKEMLTEILQKYFSDRL
jgi:CheY-like chemotaxis protein